MWGIILNINSVLWALSGTYFVYAVGVGIITWSGKQILLGIVVFAFFSVAEVVIAGIAEP